MSDSIDPFEFIPCIPLHSVIAKRPVLQSQMIKKKESAENNVTVEKKTSIQDIPSDSNIGSGNNISINLFNPDHEV